MSTFVAQPPVDRGRAIGGIVDQLKKQGLFDRFRKECLADVDTKPAYQNLQHRVEGAVARFLSTQKWRPDLNKNQLRDQLRRHITESQMLSTGVDRVVEQVVNPKISKVFKAEVDKAICEYLGIDQEEWSSKLRLRDELRLRIEQLEQQQKLEEERSRNNPQYSDFDDYEDLPRPSQRSSKRKDGILPLMDVNMQDGVTPNPPPADPLAPPPLMGPPTSTAPSTIDNALLALSNSAPGTNMWNATTNGPQTMAYPPTSIPGYGPYMPQGFPAGYPPGYPNMGYPPGIPPAQWAPGMMTNTMGIPMPNLPPGGMLNMTAQQMGLAAMPPVPGTEPPLDAEEKDKKKDKPKKKELEPLTVESFLNIPLPKSEPPKPKEKKKDAGKDEGTTEEVQIVCEEVEQMQVESMVIDDASATPGDTADNKVYHFAWDNVDDDAMSDVTISSIHTSDLSTFYEDDQSHYQDIDGEEGDWEEEEEEEEEEEDGDEAADAGRDADSVTPISSPVKDRPTKTPEKAKPRKLLSLSYNYSDSDDDETREERKARIAREKEERYLRRQQRRAELEAKKKDREDERARLRAEKVKVIADKVKAEVTAEVIIDKVEKVDKITEDEVKVKVDEVMANEVVADKVVEDEVKVEVDEFIAEKVTEDEVKVEVDTGEKVAEEASSSAKEDQEDSEAKEKSAEESVEEKMDVDVESEEISEKKEVDEVKVEVTAEVDVKVPEEESAETKVEEEKMEEKEVQDDGKKDDDKKPEEPSEEKAAESSDQSESDPSNIPLPMSSPEKPAPASPQKRRASPRKRPRISKEEAKEILREQKVMEKRMALRKRRTKNRRYLSDDFTSIYTERKNLLSGGVGAEAFVEEEVVVEQGVVEQEIIEIDLTQGLDTGSQDGQYSYTIPQTQEEVITAEQIIEIPVPPDPAPPTTRSRVRNASEAKQPRVEDIPTPPPQAKTKKLRPDSPYSDISDSSSTSDMSLESEDEFGRNRRNDTKQRHSRRESPGSPPHRRASPGSPEPRGRRGRPRQHSPSPVSSPPPELGRSQISSKHYDPEDLYKPRMSWRRRGDSDRRQRYDSSDLYKPRMSYGGSRRRARSPSPEDTGKRRRLASPPPPPSLPPLPPPPPDDKPRPTDQESVYEPITTPEHEDFDDVPKSDDERSSEPSSHTSSRSRLRSMSRSRRGTRSRSHSRSRSRSYSRSLSRSRSRTKSSRSRLSSRSRSRSSRSSSRSSRSSSYSRSHDDSDRDEYEEDDDKKKNKTPVNKVSFGEAAKRAQRRFIEDVDFGEAARSFQAPTRGGFPPQRFGRARGTIIRPPIRGVPPLGIRHPFPGQFPIRPGMKRGVPPLRGGPGGMSPRAGGPPGSFRPFPPPYQRSKFPPGEPLSSPERHRPWARTRSSDGEAGFTRSTSQEDIHSRSSGNVSPGYWDEEDEAWRGNSKERRGFRRGGSPGRGGSPEEGEMTDDDQEDEDVDYQGSSPRRPRRRGPPLTPKDDDDDAPPPRRQRHSGASYDDADDAEIFSGGSDDNWRMTRASRKRTEEEKAPIAKRLRHH